MKRRLSPEDRGFFSLVARIAVTNPFTDERAAIDAEIGGGSADEEYRQRAARAIRRIGDRIARLDKEEEARIDQFDVSDRDLISYTFLYDIYCRFADDLDRLIREQIEREDESSPVPFAADAIAMLERRGFPRDEAVRDFALFFQIRRAFYFIFQNLIGESPCMKELRRDLWNNIFTSDILWYNRYLWDRMEDFSTLLLGETGTGKGSAAAAIGRSGFIPFDPRRRRFEESFTGTFISLNLSQFPETLIESELFGHRKGAFTGAVEDHLGVFSACSPHGSIFLDEIGEVSVPVQIKLLQVVQERTFSPVGSHEKHRFRGRVIAATNRTLRSLRREGSFRDDFYYRLCSDIIVVPPLRQRIAENPGELELLVRHTLRRTLGEDAPEMVSLVMDGIERNVGRDYPWPGNVRELEQCVRRILLKRRYEGDREALASDLRSELLEKVDCGALDAAGLVEGYCALLYERRGSYEEVARLTGLDRRTVKKYVTRWAEGRTDGGKG